MYKNVCPDIFKGATKTAVESIDDFGLNKETTETIKSVVSMAGDYAWIAVALAKYKDGDPVLDIVLEKWETIQKESDKAQKEFDFGVDEGFIMFTVYYETLIRASRYFLTRSVSEIDDDESKYNPYGLLHYLACSLRTAYDFFVVLAREKAEDNDKLLKIARRYFPILQDIATTEYEAIVSMSRELSSVVHDIPGLPGTISFAKMFKEGSSLKQLRNDLYTMISTAIVGNTNDGVNEIAELIKALHSHGAVDIVSMGMDQSARPRKRRGSNRRSRVDMPDDIEDVFDGFDG